LDDLPAGLRNLCDFARVTAGSQGFYLQTLNYQRGKKNESQHVPGSGTATIQHFQNKRL